MVKRAATGNSACRTPVLDLIVTGNAAHLFGPRVGHPHTGSPDRMSATDQSSAGV